jgi:nicotinic acid mononucleotide adenylyltransferase
MEQSPPLAKRQRSSSAIVAITGSSSSGKTALARSLHQQLQGHGIAAEVVEQDRHRQRSSQNKITYGGKQMPTWEGPQFTDWTKLYATVTKAAANAQVVIVEGYLLLDALHLCPQLGAMFDAIIFVESTKEQVVARRDSAPRGWKSKPLYAEHCVWPVHVAYLDRVAAARVMDGGHPRAAYLPAADDKQARLQAALGRLRGWFPSVLQAACSGGGAVSSSSSSSSSAPASSSSSSSSTSSELSAEQRARVEANRQAALQRRDGPPAFAPTLDRSRPIVLVTHGSMNPVHSGHVDMMVRAKAALEATGFRVARGVLGITNASHIRAKGVPPIEDAERLRLLELAAASQSGWLTHCGGRGVEVTSARQLATKLKPQLPPQALIALVEGSDVFARYPPRQNAFTDDAVLVIAPRGEGDAAKAKQRREKLRAGSDKVLVLPSDARFAAVSSTRVRAALQDGDRGAVAEICGEAVATALLRGEGPADAAVA